MAQAYRSAADVLALLDTRTSESSTAVSEDRKRLYRQAAAVLVSFTDPASLQPIGGDGKPGEALDALKSVVIPATGRSFEGQVMLDPEARRVAIAELPTIKDRLNALSANPNERRGSLQRQLERYLLNQAVRLEEQPPEQLDETLQIVTWLEGTLDDLPEVRQVQARLALRSFSEPLESLAGDAVFRGRRSELDQLRSYIGVLEPVALLRRLADKALRWVRPTAAPALSISGPGGVGKSALVARFMLEHSRVSADARIPFAYLDFDRSVLSVNEPRTLLGEMLYQLDLQFDREGYFRELLEKFREMMGTEESDNTGLDSYDDRVLKITEDLMATLETQLGPRPFVVVLDTFEEVQYRGENLAFPFWDLLDQMQQRSSFLRVIISGRAPVSSLVLAGEPPKLMELGELDHEAAVAYLQGLGIQDRGLAQTLVKQLGGVPLSLKLAASVVKREGIEGVKDISGRSRFWFSTSDESIQGVLYSRILGHLHDPVLERLAHPGLVLRRISPAVILNVLNEPCELGISSIEEAEDLFVRLRRETGLVASDTLDGSLVHRADLRRTMLKFLVERMPERAAEINQRAVKWYSTQTGWRAKAEELYHRLQLGEYPSDPKLDDPEVRSSLQSSMSELPPAAQKHLATKGFQIDPEVLKEATQEEREEALAADVESMLPYGPRSVEHARTILETDFSSDHASPLFCSAARVAAQQERFEDAVALINHGLEFSFQELHSREALALLCEKAWLLRQRPVLGEPDETLPLLEDYSRRYDRLTAILQHRIQAYELAMRDPESTPNASTLLTEISVLLTRLSSAELWFVFPLLEVITEHLTEEIQSHLLKLIYDVEGPFLKVQFFSGRAQEALQFLIKIASANDLRSFPQTMRRLCEAWPFQILGVKPPYSSRSVGFESATL